MKTLHTRPSVPVVDFCQKLFDMERTGRYGRGLSMISAEWADPHFLPDTSAMDPREGAEVYLRFGALLGFHGHNLQLADAQLRSKNVLTTARDRFAELGETEKSFEAENYLALAYWRNGEHNEALAWIDTSLAAMPAGFSRNKLHAFVIRSLVLLSLGRYAEIIDSAAEVGPAFFRFGDAFLTGSFCTNVAVSYKNTGSPADAMRYLELARGYFESARHCIYLGMVENNLAQLYKETRRFARAQAAVDNAIGAFRKAKDRTREGFAFDTKASIHLDEGEEHLALEAIRSAVKLLRRSENAAYLAESLQTKFRIELKINDTAAAIATLMDAVNIARLRISEEASERIFEQFRLAANERAGSKISEKPPVPASVERGNLQLVLPESLAGFDDYQGIWMNNEHLAAVGLPKGSLAVIVSQSVCRGDLVAISETETGAVSCGFYDEEFGIVCVEGINTEPQLFDAKDVRVLGKIIGVCRRGEDDHGKMIVDPLTER